MKVKYRSVIYTRSPNGIAMQHVRLKSISLRSRPEFNEAWLQSIIADDPTILGLGDLVLKDYERIQSKAGRLDLLLQDLETRERYEVEIQLGATDESHIIRTIEYWDIERRRYPQYDHVAVIIAEDITSRFLNIVSLFNGFIPIMALQLTAIETPEGIGLQFTKVLDTVRLGLVDEDEEVAESTDREFWQTKRGTEKTVQLADSILEIAKEFVPTAELNYNKHAVHQFRRRKHLAMIDDPLPLRGRLAASVRRFFDLFGHELHSPIQASLLTH